jgi:hypothetical protein
MRGEVEAGAQAKASGEGQGNDSATIKRFSGRQMRCLGRGKAGPRSFVILGRPCPAPHPETSLREVSDLSPQKSGERLRSAPSQPKLITLYRGALPSAPVANASVAAADNAVL